MARIVGLSRQAIHKSVKKLQSQGLVQLVQTPHNKKTKNIILTPDGKKLKKNALTIIGEIDRELTDSLGEEKLKQFKEMMIEFIETLDKREFPHGE